MKCLRAVPMWILLILCSQGLALSYSGGNGAPADPYQISSADDLQQLMNTPGDWGAHFILTRDIDASGLISPVPIGFTGTFDGKGYAVLNLTMVLQSRYRVGLFGYIQGGTVRNLGVVDCNITGWGFVGGLCGENVGGAIINCYVTGSVVSPGGGVGGLCGRNQGQIAQCYSTAIVGSKVSFKNRGSARAGGFCGRNEYGTISDCYATGNVTAGRSRAGGFCGMIYGGTITNCYATGHVFTGDELEDGYAGGFCGELLYGAISNCYATGNATAGHTNLSLASYAGGFCGFNRAEGRITQCYAMGDAKAGDQNAGGFCGQNSGLITRCYAKGNSETFVYAGGFCGSNYGQIARCYATGNAGASIDQAGGFCGYNYSAISNCFSTGNAHAGDTWAGGFCGVADGGSFTNCYSTGVPSVVGGFPGLPGMAGGFCGKHDSGTYIGIFWDVQASGFSEGFGNGYVNSQVQGKPTSVMHQQATFESAGWDFRSIWTILEGYTYPCFRDMHSPFPTRLPVDPSLAVGVPALTKAGAAVFLCLVMIGMLFLGRRMSRRNVRPDRCGS